MQSIALRFELAEKDLLRSHESYSPGILCLLPLVYSDICAMTLYFTTRFIRPPGFAVSY